MKSTNTINLQVQETLAFKNANISKVEDSGITQKNFSRFLGQLRMKRWLIDSRPDFNGNRQEDLLLVERQRHFRY